MGALLQPAQRLWRRAVTVAAAALMVGIIALVLRALSAGGSFAEAPPRFDGRCRTVAALPVADIALDAKSNVAYLAVGGGRHGGAADGLYALSLGAADAKPVRLTGVPADFHPLALALTRESDGELTLYVANRRSDKFGSIDVFQLDGTALKEVASIGSSLFAHVTAIAAAGTGRFYAAITPPGRTDFLALLTGYLRPARGEIVYFDGQVPRVVAKDLRRPQGLSLSPDAGKLIVAESVAHSLRFYDVQPLSGRLDADGDYPLAIAPSHLALDGNGHLWVAGDSDLFARQTYADDAAKPSTSAVAEIALESGLPQHTLASYGFDQIAAAGTAVFAGGRLVLGSVLDDRLVACADHGVLR